MRIYIYIYVCKNTVYLNISLHFIHKGTPCNGVEHVIAKRARPHNPERQGDGGGNVGM